MHCLVEMIWTENAAVETFINNQEEQVDTLYRKRYVYIHMHCMASFMYIVWQAIQTN